MGAGLPRYFANYRWELWLIRAALIVRTLVILPLDLLLGSDEAFFNLQTLLGIALLLLAGSYLRVRRLGRDFLALLWGYVVVVSHRHDCSSCRVVFGVEYPRGSSTDGYVICLWTCYGSAVSCAPLVCPPRIKTQPHPCVLLGRIRVFALFGSVQGSETTDSNTAMVAHLLVGFAIALSVMLLKVWLLGNFDLRSAGFRRNAVIGLVTATILSGFIRVLIGELIGYGEGPYSTTLPLLGVFFGLAAFAATTAFAILTLLVLFALVYLVRVRQSPATAPSVRSIHG